ncbi:MAG: class II fructose-bisphosphate aldolase [Candidatus Pacebacteria bacterium]|nr:class II fructose-bisphosphate aldolase [Candidatus Paceibacterota bacterium]MDD3728871.1 class II fructose-bisphosphate aldolase [Candidatus Paceibacterota bacterium]MDD5445755.1 class II fructose-bisphosphate aldolase [Candidatus Paceibacterota bacterium]
MKSLHSYFEKAKKEKFAVGQFNFSTIEQMKSTIRAAKKMESPVILGTSEGEGKFFGLKEAFVMKEIINLEYNVPVFLNLDHGKNFDFIKTAVDIGYDSVHYDGSLLPFDENIKRTKEVVSYAKKRGVLVEGELGVIKDKSSVSKKDFTSLSKVERFVKETNVDLLAISIGNVHGVYVKMPSLDLNLLSEIRKKTEIFLVLHGASGLKNEDIKNCIKRGIVKTNINTELRNVWKESLKKELSSKEIKPYKILEKTEKVLEKRVIEKIKTLHSFKKI